MVNVYIFSQKQFNKIMKDMSWYDDTIDMITDTAIVSICNTDRSMIHWFADKHNNVLSTNFFIFPPCYLFKNSLFPNI